MTEQGAQALRDFPESDDPQINEERALLRVGFLRGAEWQASRQPEAAPFDTDPGIAEDEPDLPNGHAPVERLTPFVARRVRASQPVQVEVTDGRLFCEVHGHTCPAGHYRCRKVEVTADAVQVFWYEHDCEWVSKYCDEHHQRSAWVSRAALGGGE